VEAQKGLKLRQRIHFLNESKYNDSVAITVCSLSKLTSIPPFGANSLHYPQS
jgi:hypothetical protein